EIPKIESFKLREWRTMRKWRWSGKVTRGHVISSLRSSVGTAQLTQSTCIPDSSNTRDATLSACFSISDEMPASLKTEIVTIGLSCGKFLAQTDALGKTINSPN